jgi:hypothetical protein
MKVSYDKVSDVYGYGTEKAPKTSSKSFTIPIEELTEEKSKTYKVTQSCSSGLNITIPLTYIGGYDKFDPFQEITETGSFKIPEGMQTKRTPTRSDEEILKDMEELAKEHAKMGTFQSHDDKRFAKLMDEYISSVSPDRESLLKKETNEILKRIEYEMSGTAAEDVAEKAKKKNEELIDYLMEAIDNRKGNKEEKNDYDVISSIIAARGNNIAANGNNVIASRSDGYYTAIDFDRGDGKVTTLVYDNQGNKMPWMMMKSDMYSAGVMNGAVDNAFFYDENGVTIAVYHHNKLNQAYTKAENERMQEIVGTYNAAFDVAYGKKGYSNNETSIMGKTEVVLKSV